MNIHICSSMVVISIFKIISWFMIVIIVISIMDRTTIIVLFIRDNFVSILFTNEFVISSSSMVISILVSIGHSPGQGWIIVGCVSTVRGARPSSGVAPAAAMFAVV